MTTQGLTGALGPTGPDEQDSSDASTAGDYLDALRHGAGTMASPRREPDPFDKLTSWVARGAQLASRPFEVAGNVLGNVVNPQPWYAKTPEQKAAESAAAANPEPLGRFRNWAGAQVSEFEQRPLGEQNLLSLPFMGGTVPGAVPGAVSDSAAALRASAETGAFGAADRLATVSAQGQPGKFNLGRLLGAGGADAKAGSPLEGEIVAADARASGGGSNGSGRSAQGALSAGEGPIRTTISNERGAASPIDLPDIIPGLTKTEETKNNLTSWMGKFRAPDEPVATAAMRWLKQVKPTIESAANRLSAQNAARIGNAFETDKFGRVPELEGIDPTLTAAQSGKALGPGATGPSGEAIAQPVGGAGPLAPTIADVAARLPLYLPHMSGQQIQAMRALKFDLQPYADTLARVGVDLNQRGDIIEGGFYVPRGGAEVAGEENPLKIYTGGSGRGKKGFEQSASFPSQAHGVDAGYTYAPLQEALADYGKAAGNDIAQEHVSNYFKTVSVDSGQGAEPLAQGINPETGIPRGRNTIGLPNLAGQTFPDAVANAANKVINAEGPNRGPLALPLDVVKATNNLMLGAQVTLTNSAPFIHGWLTALGSPRQAGEAFLVSMKAWVDPRAVGDMMQANDLAPIGGMKAADWAKAGVHFGGGNTGYTTGLRGVPVAGAVFGRANAVYGADLDALRLATARSLLSSELEGGYKVLGKQVPGATALNKPRTMAEIRSSGDLNRIGDIVNKMTGWSPNQTGGGLGNAMTYAGQFLQSRLETVGKAMMAPAKEVARLGGGSGAGLDEKIAFRSLAKLMATGTMLTVAANAAQGRETDFRPVIRGPDGRLTDNPAFMRVRAFGRNWSIFGTWDSLLREGIQVATGNGGQALRSLSSPTLGTGIDLVTGTDFSGKPTTDTPLNAAKTVLTKFLPLGSPSVGEGVQQIKQGQPVDAGASALQAATGAKGPLVTPMQDFKSYVEKASGKPYDQVPTKQLLAYQHTDPTGAVLWAKEQAKGFPATPQGKVSAAVNTFDQGRLQGETEATKALGAGGSGKAFNAQMGTLRTNKLQQEAGAYATLGARNNPAPSDKTSSAYALWQYRDALAGAQKAGGGVDWNAIQDKLDTMRGAWTPAQRTFVDQSTGEAYHATPEARLWQDTKDKQKALDYARLYKNLPDLKDPARLAAYEQYLKAPDKQAWLAKFPNPVATQKGIDAITAKAKQLQDDARAQDPELDYGLTKTQGLVPVLASTQKRYADSLPPDHRIDALMNGRTAFISGTEIGHLHGLDYNTLESIARADPQRLYQQIMGNRVTLSNGKLEGSPASLKDAQGWVEQARKITGVQAQQQKAAA